MASPRSRSYLPTLASALLLSACLPSTPPNLVLVTIDTLRADRLGSYGYHKDTSPHLDRLAARGVRYEFAIAQSATTPISCASLLTGMYPYAHGLRTMHGHRENTLRDDVSTLPEELRRLGYRTAAFVSAYPASSRYGLARGFQHFDEEFLTQRGDARITATGEVHTGRSQRPADETNRHLLAWLREHASERFFVWVHYFDPHDPVFVPPDPLLEKFGALRAGSSAEERLSAIYDAEVAFTDAHVGDLVAELERLDLLDRTVLAVTSDHGQGLGDHGWWGHGILYQEQIRVPLILHGPGIPQGRVVSGLTEHVDLFPTLLEVAGSDRGPRFAGKHGQSLLPVLSGERALQPKPHAYSETRNLRSVSGSRALLAGSELRSIIRDGMKLIHHPRDSSLDELFDLGKDPRELDNLVDTRKEVARALREELIRMAGEDEGVAEEPGVPAEDYPHLKALGYVE